MQFESLSKKEQIYVKRMAARDQVAEKSKPAACLDSKKRYLWWNEQWEKMFDPNETLTVGIHHYDAYPTIPKEHPEWVKMHDRCLKGEEIHITNDNFKEILDFEYKLIPVDLYGEICMIMQIQ